MIKEAKNIDFYTTGRQPSDQDFERISEWIRKKKKKIKKANLKTKAHGQTKAFTKAGGLNIRSKRKNETVSSQQI